MLGEQLAAVDATGVTAALAEYQRIRVPRANKTVRMARRVGDVARMQNRLGVAVRDGALRATPASMLRSQLTRAWRLLIDPKAVRTCQSWIAMSSVSLSMNVLLPLVKPSGMPSGIKPIW